MPVHLVERLGQGFRHNGLRSRPALHLPGHRSIQGFGSSAGGGVAAALLEAKKLLEKEWPAFNLRPKSMRYVALLLPILCLMVSQVLRTSSVNNAQSSIRLKIFLASSR
jgi:hypothetical protein